MKYPTTYPNTGDLPPPLSRRFTFSESHIPQSLVWGGTSWVSLFTVDCSSRNQTTLCSVLAKTQGMYYTGMTFGSACNVLKILRRRAIERTY